MENKTDELKHLEDLHEFLCSAPVIIKGEKVQFNKTKYNFAKYCDIKDGILPYLKKYNLYVNHSVVPRENVIYLQSCLFHTRKELPLKTSEVPLPDFLFESSYEFPKPLGSAISYFKKYNLLAMLDLSTDDMEENHVERKGSLGYNPEAQAPQANVKKNLLNPENLNNESLLEKLQTYSEKNTAVTLTEIIQRFIARVNAKLGKDFCDLNTTCYSHEKPNIVFVN